jgi:hypothetical protein
MMFANATGVCGGLLVAMGVMEPIVASLARLGNRPAAISD